MITEVKEKEEIYEVTRNGVTHYVPKSGGTWLSKETIEWISNGGTVVDKRLDDKKLKLINSIIEIAENVAESGIVSYGGNDFRTSRNKVQDLQGLHYIKSLGKGPATIMQTDALGNRVQMTLPDLEEIGNAISIFRDSISRVASTKIAEVSALQSITSADLYDVNAGWP